MIRLALCDDNGTERESIVKCLTRLEEDINIIFEIYEFCNGKSLLEQLENVNFDIVVLDIIMNGIDGIETAKNIRKINQTVKIIFISSYDSRVKELFKLDTIAFIDKPINYANLKEALNLSISKINNDNKNIFVYSKNGVTENILISDILYFESMGHYIVITTLKNSIRIKYTMKRLWGELESNEYFIRPHKSYIFNIKYISISKTQIILDIQNLKVSIGAKYKENTINKVMLFLNKGLGD